MFKLDTMNKNKGNKELFLKLGHKIKFERSKKDITQQYLAELAGMSTSAIGHIETGKSDVKFSNLYAIAKAFDMELPEFLDFKL